MNLNLPDDFKGISKIQIEELFDAAVIAMNSAYAPYSKFRVGAAILTEDGNIVTGCNVENGSFGATVCAERVAIFKAVSEGEKSFQAILIVADFERPVPPCGICRQVLDEFSGTRTVIMSNTQGECEIYSFSEMLPHSFQLEGNTTN